MCIYIYTNKLTYFPRVLSYFKESISSKEIEAYSLEISEFKFLYFMGSDVFIFYFFRETLCRVGGVPAMVTISLDLSLFD